LQKVFNGCTSPLVPPAEIEDQSAITVKQDIKWIVRTHIDYNVKKSQKTTPSAFFFGVIFRLVGFKLIRDVPKGFLLSAI